MLQIYPLIKGNPRQNLSRLPRRSFEFPQDLLAMTIKLNLLTIYYLLFTPYALHLTPHTSRLTPHYLHSTLLLTPHASLLPFLDQFLSSSIKNLHAPAI